MKVKHGTCGLMIYMLSSCLRLPHNCWQLTQCFLATGCQADSIHQDVCYGGRGARYQLGRRKGCASGWAKVLQCGSRFGWVVANDNLISNYKSFQLSLLDFRVHACMFKNESRLTWQDITTECILALHRNRKGQQWTNLVWKSFGWYLVQS